MSISNILSLLSGIALFLFGMTLMGDGLKRVAGNKLEVTLYRLSSTPLRGLLLGTGVTAVIQSSSATSVMVVGFVNSGMLQFRQAIGIILGACLGTSITGWVLCLSSVSGSGWASLLSTATLTSVVAVVGIILLMFSKKRQQRDFGSILLGFAVLMFGMQAMSAAVSPLRDSPVFIEAILSLSNPLIGIAIGIVLAAVLQSASAAIGILQALSMTGAIAFSVALPIILGIGIGAAVPVLLSALGANTNGKRAAWIYLIINVLGAAIVGLVFYALNAALRFSFMDMTMDPVSIALVNTLFRFAYLLILAPAIGLLDRLVCKLIPSDPDDEALTADIDRLEERFLAHPAVAVEQCRLTICSMAEKAELNLQLAFGLLGYYEEENYQKVVTLEQVVDRYEDKLGNYLMRLTGKDMPRSLSRKVSEYLHAISDFERLSDHALNVADCAKEISEKDVHFSDKALHELDVLTAAVVDILDLTVRAFTKNDQTAAVRIEPLEECIDTLCDELKMNHVERLQRGECTLQQGFVFNDLITNYKRISDHCSNIGVAIIESESDVYDPHAYLTNVKEHQSVSFRQNLAADLEKYKL